jgi:ATP-dependent DNA helicase RecQ
VNETPLDPENWLENFGLDGFRPGQRNVIEAIMAGNDTLCIMPTGGGKSLCFQLPTIAREGVTIVISPLIALMKDQVDSLVATGIPATFINSSLAPAQQQARINGMTSGEYKLVYIAPERLRSNSFMRAVQKTQIQLLAVDEAHCISQWGHDFRPDYARLGRFRKRLGNPQTIALTATATRLVQDDIISILELKDPAAFVTGFARSNLAHRVNAPNGNAEKDNQLIEFLKSCEGCGIIYASTRKNCEHLVELLENEIGREITFYHAGLPAESRRTVQEKFMSGEIEVIVATNAFGMGIDKSDLRFVVHYNLPGSIEAYYQEAGRAGRDGKPSDCLMLYSFQDKFIQEFFIDNSYPSREMIREVYQYLCSLPGDPIETTLQDIKDDLGLSLGTTGIATCENLLEKANAIERLDSRQNAAAIRIDSDLPSLIDLLPREARAQRQVMRELEKIVGSFRGERILFHPQKFAERLEMKWESVNRAIRQLIKLPMVDYIPPFRGRAIHVVDRKKRFAELEIDFAELARRQKAEYDKLQSVIRFATTRRCRQLEILEYFGDPDRHLCGNCDNCCKLPQSKIGTAANSDSDACMYAAQVALSGTARTHGRIGKTLIAQMLTGSASKKVKQLALDRLSTFGLLKCLRQTDVVALMEFLIQQGFIIQMETTKFRPVTSISQTGRQLMSGESYVDLPSMMPGDLVNTLSTKLRGKTPHRMPLKTSAVTRGLDQVAGHEFDENSGPTESELGGLDDNDDLSVKESDKSVERSAMDIPDDSEIEFEESFQNEPESFDDAPDEIEPEQEVANDEIDQGRLNADDHASGTAHATAVPISNISNGKQRVRVDLPDPAAVQPTFYWTWRLLADGYSMDHLRQVRQLDAETIFDHAIRAMENNLPGELHWLLTTEKIQTLERIVAQHPAERKSNLISKLPDGFLPQELIFFLKCRSAF